MTTVGATGRMHCLGPFEHWDRGFESRSRHGCVSPFFRIVLSCVGRGLAMGRFPFKGVLLKRVKGFIVSGVNSTQVRGPNGWKLKTKY